MLQSFPWAPGMRELAFACASVGGMSSLVGAHPVVCGAGAVISSCVCFIFCSGCSPVIYPGLPRKVVGASTGAMGRDLWAGSVEWRRTAVVALPSGCALRSVECDGDRNQPAISSPGRALRSLCLEHKLKAGSSDMLRRRFVETVCAVPVGGYRSIRGIFSARLDVRASGD